VPDPPRILDQDLPPTGARAGHPPTSSVPDRYVSYNDYTAGYKNGYEDPYKVHSTPEGAGAARQTLLERSLGGRGREGREGWERAQRMEAGETGEAGRSLFWSQQSHSIFDSNEQYISISIYFSLASLVRARGGSVGILFIGIRTLWLSGSVGG